MKKTQNLLLVGLVFLTFSLQAQDRTSIASAYIGIGGQSEGAKIKTPAFYASYEHFIYENLSLGGIVGYSTLTVENSGTFAGGEDKNFSNFVLGGLANYYFYENNNFEVYGTVALGYGSGLSGGILYQLGAGGRYKLSDSLYLNSELGIGLSLLKVGVSFHL